MRITSSMVMIATLSFAFNTAAANAAHPQAAVAPAVAAALLGATPDLQYKLSAGDKIHVSVYGEDTLTGDYIITSAGNLTFPLLNNISASGHTVEELQSMLARALSDGYVNNAQVSIQVLAFLPFYILGEVAHPGAYPVTTGLTLQQAVAAAGGYTYRANLRRAFFKHADEASERPVNPRTDRNIFIQAGDTIRISERHF